MSLHERRKHVSSRQASQAGASDAVTKSSNDQSSQKKIPDENAKKVVFIDDEVDFLNALRLAATDLSEIDLRTIQATPDNHLLDAMDQLTAQGWSPDLLCIDLNEASGKGIAGTDYLNLMRKEERWLGLPIVVTTKTNEISKDEADRRREGDLVYNIYKLGADGYFLGKFGDRRYLRSIVDQFPSWKHQARNRLWQGLLEENRKNMQSAKNKTEQIDTLRKTLEKLNIRLGIDHAFVRKGPAERCPVWVKFNGPWTDEDKIEDLTKIPLMNNVISSQGTVTKIKRITAKDRGTSKELAALKVLDGKAYMGAALMLHHQFLGVMTVVCDREDSFGSLDELHFGRLTEQVAYMLGKQWLEERNSKLRQALLTFSEKLSDTHDEFAVCQTLAETAHAVLHDGHLWSKCTVRLIEPGYPLLRRYGQIGDVVPRDDIPLRLGNGAHDSMFRRSVTEEGNPIIKAHGHKEFEKEHYFNNNKDANGADWWKSESAITAPLVLERPDSTPEHPVQSALGAINLETSEADYYKPPEIEEFIRSIALSASRHITALRTAQFAKSALELAVAAYRKRPDALWEDVHKSLSTLLGHNHLIQLEPPPDWDKENADIPWIVKRAFSSDPDRYTNNIQRWNQHFGNQEEWPKTFTKACIREFISNSNPNPLFTADEEKFQQSKELLGGEKIEANAVFPLRDSQDNNAGLHGVVLLSWFSPPVMSKTMFESVLGEFARYCTVLLRHSEDRLTGEERLRRAEDQAGIAFAARQFEHILNNRLAALQGDAEAGLLSNDLTHVHDILKNMRQQLKHLDGHATKSVLYLKYPRIQKVDLKDVWGDVINELSEKAKRSNITLWPWCKSPIKNPSNTHSNTDPPISYDLHIESDKNYLWNALYVLVDNAIEALQCHTTESSRDVWIEASASPEKWLATVNDNGPGVANPNNLFIYGKSEKQEGQGIALALARDRLSKIEVFLSYTHRPNRSGAIFRLEHRNHNGVHDD